MAIARANRLTADEFGDLCFGFLTRNPEDLMRFMSLAGYDPAGIRGALGSPALRLGMMEFIVSNEALLLRLCAEASVRPEDAMRVYYKLNPGG